MGVDAWNLCTTAPDSFFVSLFKSYSVFTLWLKIIRLYLLIVFTGSFVFIIYKVFNLTCYESPFYVYNLVMSYKKYIPTTKWDFIFFFYTLIIGLLIALISLFILIPIYFYQLFFFFNTKFFCCLLKQNWFPLRTPKLESLNKPRFYTWRLFAEKFFLLPKIWALSSFYYLTKFSKKKKSKKFITVLWAVFRFIFFKLPKWYFYIMADFYLDLIITKKNTKNNKPQLTSLNNFFNKSKKWLYILINCAWNKSIFFTKYKQHRVGFTEGKKYRTKIR